MHQCQLDVLLVVPTGAASHRAHASAPAHRLAMAQLAFAQAVGMQVDACEVRRSGASYTIDTVREVAARYPGSDVVLVMGQDQFERLPTWRDPVLLRTLVHIAVARRPSLGAAPLARGPNATTIAPDADGTEPPACWLNFPPSTISATDIRHRVQHKLDLTRLVSEPVARYIERHQLYLPPTRTTAHDH